MSETNKVLQYLIKKCNEEKLRLTGVLGQGLAKDHADYRYQCGVLRGITIVENMLTETAERLENYDE